MVGRSRFLAVFYHESAPLADGTQKLGYLLFDATTNQTITKGSVCGISKGSSLLWAGFSNDGSLLTMDSDGMVSMLVCSSSLNNNESIPSSWEWMPMLDTVGLHKSAEDSYWPITMYDAKLICVPLKGGLKHPDAARRPVTAALGLRLPLARGALTKRYVYRRNGKFSWFIFSFYFSPALIYSLQQCPGGIVGACRYRARSKEGDARYHLGRRCRR
jgi:hypothetical protein